MCGIVGLVFRDPSRSCDPELVTAMRDSAIHRGPDDAGVFVDGAVGLGHRRLSIIDLAGGHQPMADATGTSWIVFNGEIYNYRTLREQLVAKGYRFQTHSDTEVILNLYADAGEACVSQMNGMFAFAIWDSRRRSLFLARDRMGVKPLYYADTPAAFAFASEIKALFASRLVTPECRDEALAEYLTFRQVAGPDTMFRGIKALPPGCTMTLRDGVARMSQYWNLRPSDEPSARSYTEAVASLHDLLEDSVRLRLISDVPVGTFCSGGVDSSLVTAMATRQHQGPVNTFSVGFDDAAFDESVYARMVSAHCGTTHHELRVDNVPFNDLLDRIIWHNDEPLDFANSVHIFALSELAKRTVTVVLTGEGSDELFAGYPRYRIPELARKLSLVPAPLRRMAAALSGDHRIQKLNRFADAGRSEAMLYNSSYLRPEVVAELSPRFATIDTAFRQASLAQWDESDADPVGRLSLLDQETFLVGILHRQDKMSMAAAVESRVPFLDYRIVQFANQLPTAFKIRGGIGKAVVKDVALRLLPAEVVRRKKSGFGVPLARWFRADTGLGQRLDALPESPGSEMFDRAVLRRLIAEHRSGGHDHSETLWTALNVATWRQTFHC